MLPCYCFQRYLFTPDASPAWSGVTFSNSQINWQTFLSETLGLQPGSLTNQPNLPADPYYLYANELVSPSALVSETTRGTSYAMGGATSGHTTLYQFSQPTLAKKLNIENLGVAAQLSAALGEQAVRLNSSDLAVVWAGGNDLLVAFGAQKSLSESLDQLVVQLRNDLETVLHFGDAPCHAYSHFSSNRCSECRSISSSLPLGINTGRKFSNRARVPKGMGKGNLGWHR